MQTNSRYKFTEIIAALLILLFGYTGVSKIIDHDSFKIVIGQSPLIGKANVLLSWLLPVAEIFLAIVLVIPSFRKTGFLIASLLMLVFTGYIFYMLATSAHLPCSCGGVLKQLNWRAHLVVNIFFTILAVAGWIVEKKNKRIIAIIPRPR